MKYVFPEGLYTDVRIEHVYSTEIVFTMQNLEQCKEKKYSAAFVRVYDGSMWYYASTSDLGGIQGEIDALAKLAATNPNLAESEVYKRLKPHQDIVMSFVSREVSQIPLDTKLELLKSTMPQIEENKFVQMWQLLYMDTYTVKEFYSSKGANLKFDYQNAGFGAFFTMVDGEKKMDGAMQIGGITFGELTGFETKLEAELKECEAFLLNSVLVVPGKYSVIFAPKLTGLFIHECFGHKSESDFMIGDETTRKEWQIGKEIGSPELTVAETGNIIGRGFTPYDDEGNKATMTYLIKNGILAGRLHNADSAADLEEDVTGNARAVSFEYEPIVRMTTTYLDKGSKTYEELISETKEGILLTDAYHGSGLSTFTIAPRYSYMIRDGKISEPVRVSVVTGNVLEALSDIDGISNKVEMFEGLIMCGKVQFPLPVGMAGPYIRVKNMNVQ
jgi:TldD protein